MKAVKQLSGKLRNPACSVLLMSLHDHLQDPCTKKHKGMCSFTQASVWHGSMKGGKTSFASTKAYSTGEFKRHLGIRNDRGSTLWPKSAASKIPAGLDSPRCTMHDFGCDKEMQKALGQEFDWWQAAQLGYPQSQQALVQRH